MIPFFDPLVAIRSKVLTLVSATGNAKSLFRRKLGRVAPSLCCLASLTALVALDVSAQDPVGTPFLADYSTVVEEREVWDIAQDFQGLLYLATGTGVVEYDGVSSRLLPLDNGSIARSLAAHASGRLYVGGIGEIGVFDRDETGQLSYSALRGPELEGLRDVWRLWPTEEGFLAWSLDRVLRWDGRGFESWPLDRRVMPGLLHGRLILADTDGVLWTPAADGLQEIARLLDFGERARLFWQMPDGGVIIGTSQGHLWRLAADEVHAMLDGTVQELRPERFVTEVDSLFEQRRLYDGVVLADGRIALATMAGGVAVIDGRGRLQARLDRTVGLPDDAVWSVELDRGGGLWLGMSRGLARASLDVPLTAYGEPFGLDGKVQSIAHSQGQLWVATSLGLFRSSDGRFSQVDGVRAPVWSLLTLPVGEDEDLLLVGASDGLYDVSVGTVRQVHGARHAFSLQASKAHPGWVWVGHENGLAVFASGQSGRLAASPLGELETQAQIRSIAEADDGVLWLGTLVNGVMRVELSAPGDLADAQIQQLGGEQGLEEINSVKLFSHRGQIFAATGLGLRVWDDEQNRFEPSPLFGADTGGIARVMTGEDASFWLSRDDRYPMWVQVAADDRRQARHVFRHLPTKDVYSFLPQEVDGGAWIGTSKGLFHFRGQPDDGVARAKSGRELVMRDILVDGERQSLSGPLELPNHQARLHFRWVDPAFGDPREQRYRYRLRGLDEDWSDWTAATRAEYMNLPGGEYAFEVEGRDLTDSVFSRLAVELRAPPPWYLTLQARLGWLGITGALIWLGVAVRSRALEHERRRLEEQVAERTRDLKAARDEANAAAEAKSQFLANMSHEIRTPMNGVIGVAELLMGAELEGRERRYAEVIHKSASSLLSLIDDILDFSKIEAGEMRLDEHDFDLADAIDTVIDMLAAMAREKEIELVAELAPDVPATVRGDSNRLRQVLLNLAGNGIKFTEAGSVRIEVNLDQADGEHAVIRFEVIDTGIGIADDQQHRLFKPFSQVDASRKRRFGGTGLGLMISKQLVELMDGDIGVHSRAGEGSTFWFTARLAAPHDRLLEATAPEPVRAAALHVLVVEDNPINQLVATALLEDLGHRATVADGGPEALELVSDQAFDAVLMDIEMPGMDGLETTAKIRGLPGRAAGLPIVATTAHAMKGDREGFLAAGMDDYLSKPIRPHALREVLEAVVRRESEPAPIRFSAP